MLSHLASFIYVIVVFDGDNCALHIANYVCFIIFTCYVSITVHLVHEIKPRQLITLSIAYYTSLVCPLHM